MEKYPEEGNRKQPLHHVVSRDRFRRFERNEVAAPRLYGVGYLQQTTGSLRLRLEIVR